MRKTIAERLVKSKNEAPHFYLSLDCNIEELLRVRKTLNSNSNDKYKISVKRLIQTPNKKDNKATIVIITHKTSELNCNNCLAIFKKNINILKTPVLIRLYN